MRGGSSHVKDPALSQPAETPVPARPTAAPHVADRQKLLGHLAMLLFSALVAGSYSLGGMAVTYMAPAAINIVRFAIGIAVMAAAAAVVMRGRIPPPRAPWRYLALGALMAVFFITMFTALKLTDPVSTGAVFTLMPLMSALFGYFLLGQVPGGLVLASLVFAGLGSVWVIFRGDVGALLAFDIGRGEAIFLVGVVCHALYAPLVKKLSDSREPLVAFTLWTLVGTGLCLTAYGVRDLFAIDWGALPAVVWIAILYLAVITTASTTFLIQFGAMRLPAAKVLAYTYLTPSFVILYEGLLGHGWASPAVLAGALVTMLGLAVMAFARDG